MQTRPRLRQGKSDDFALTVHPPERNLGSVHTWRCLRCSSRRSTRRAWHGPPEGGPKEISRSVWGTPAHLTEKGQEKAAHVEPRRAPPCVRLEATVSPRGSPPRPSTRPGPPRAPRVAHVSRAGGVLVEVLREALDLQMPCLPEDLQGHLCPEAALGPSRTSSAGGGPPPGGRRHWLGDGARVARHMASGGKGGAAEEGAGRRHSAWRA